MRATFPVAACVAAALALVVAAGRISAEETKKPSEEELAKIMAEVGTPGPEHQKLAELAGSWTYTCKMWMDPNGPPIETKGTLERKPILGGRFLEETYKGTGPDGKPGFEARNVLGYDNAQKKYTMTFLCTLGTGVANGLGEASSSDTLTYKTEMFCPVRKDTIHGKDIFRLEGDDKVVIESYLIEDGKEVKAMELVSVRQ